VKCTAINWAFCRVVYYLDISVFVCTLSGNACDFVDVNYWINIWHCYKPTWATSLVEECFWRNALGLSCHLQYLSLTLLLRERSRKKNKTATLNEHICSGSNFEWYFWWQWLRFYLCTVCEWMSTTQQRRTL